MPQQKSSWRRVKLFIVWGTAASVGAVGVLLIVLIALSRSLPSVGDIDRRQITQSTKIYDRTGNILLYEVSAGEKRTVVPLGTIPKILRDATIIVEDESFYTAPGFDWRAIIRAFLVNLRSGKILQGGSTITQQLAKNAFLSPEQTISRKLKEFLLAIQLTRRYSKDQVLEFYLNEIPYGPGLYGVETASRAYFGKSVSELTLVEAATLAALPRAPSYYSPWGSHTKELFARRDFILGKLVDAGLVSKEDRAAAEKEKMQFQPKGQGIKAPHFVMEVYEYLVNKYGEDTVERGGLKVITSLDWELQELAERVIAEGVKRNTELYRGTNAALVAEDTNTGQILALVGSHDYFDVEHEGNFNVATQGLRQPGSALKPFVYARAFEDGYTPEIVLFDVPTEFVPNDPRCPSVPNFEEEGVVCFHPENFDDTFRGPVDARTALAQSINIPAVKVLYLAGLADSLDLLGRFGVTTLVDPRRYGLSLVLGGGEVKLIELVGAYATLAEDGIHRKQVMVLEVKTPKGSTIESYQDSHKEMMEPQYARMVTDILSDIDARAGLFVNSLSLTVFPDHDVALKTGTSNDYRDAWTVGYTPTLAVGVWAGNNDNKPMKRQGSSILAALPIWNAFMVEALKTQPKEFFVRPEELILEKPVLRGEYGVEGIHSILYYVDRNNPRGTYPETPEHDPQFKNWEEGVLLWVRNNNLTVPSSSINLNGPLHPIVNIREPKQGVFISENQTRLSITWEASADIREVLIYFNNTLLSTISGPLPKTYSIDTTISFQNPQPQNSIRVEVIDQNSKRGEKEIIVYTQ